MSSMVGTYYSTEKGKLLKNYANRISVNISNARYLTDDSKRLMFDSELTDKSQNEGFRIIVVDKRAQVVNDSSKTEIGKTFVTPEIVRALNRQDVAVIQPGRDTMIAAVSVLSADNTDVIGAVIIISSIDDISDTLSVINGRFIMVSLMLSGVILVLVLSMSQFILTPLRTILSSVRKISDGDLNQRVLPVGSREFAELSEAFNDMTAKMRQTDTTRQEFVSNVSHELKTPLSSIKVLSESLLLMRDAPIDMYREFLVDINSEIDRMTRIVNDLLNLVKLDRTDDALIISSLRLNTLIEGILKRLRPLAEKKRIELLYNELKQVTLDGDEVKLSLAISNLAENAIKYTDDGGTVKVTVDSDGQNAYVTVIDNGVGIAEEDQGKVFDRFYRADKARNRATGGTGLGLAITHKTVLLHHGSIKLSSKEGEGSTFVIRLPISRAGAIRG